MHHDIEIKLVDKKKALPPEPMPAMKLGDTVRYFSEAGAVTVAFPEFSPFSKENKHGWNIMTSHPPYPVIVRDGKFASGCIITTPDGKQVGWGIDGSTDGGEHVVK